MDHSSFFISVINSGKLLLSIWHEVSSSKPITSLILSPRTFFMKKSGGDATCGRGKRASAILAVLVPNSLQWRRLQSVVAINIAEGKHTGEEICSQTTIKSKF